VEQPGDGPDVLATVPLPPGGRMRIAWGAGNELLVAGLPAAASDGGAASDGQPATAAAIQWCFGSAYYKPWELQLM